MAVEVEIKAHVEDRDSLERLLRERFSFKGEYLKKDIYYRKDCTSRETEFRLREEGGLYIVTSKDKKQENGVEINLENEFTVSDATAFSAFVEKLGYQVAVTKEKQGLLFEDGDGVHIELSHVSGLGDFIEIERLIEEHASLSCSEACQEVRGLLLGLGIPESAIESRYYTDMLEAL